MDAFKLGAELARDLMSLGDEPGSPAQRMQYMGGQWPDNEKPQGGMNETALAAYFGKWLAKRAEAIAEDR